VHDCHRSFRLLGGVQKAEGEASIGVDHRMQLHLADALERTDTKGILALKLPGAALSTCRSLTLRTMLFNIGHLF
jgi:hypothetical protein